MLKRELFNFAYNEMMTHIPLCSHKEPKDVLVVGDVVDEFKSELAKHNVNVKYEETLSSFDEKNYDVVIYNDNNIDELLMANVNRIVKDDGIFVCKSERFDKDSAKLKTDLTTVGKNFWICMPFRFGHTVAIFASKKYHPTADIVLQISDLLDYLSYYSTEMHAASFVMPAYIHKELTGIAKR